MSKLWVLMGAIFGALAWPIGLFAGLQAVPVLGAVLLAPAMLLVLLTGLPLGQMGGGLMGLAFLLTIGFWAMLFGLSARVLGR